MRLFIGITFDGRAQAKLEQLRDAHRPLCKSASFSPDENLHLTLAFLGEIKQSEIEAVKRAMDSISFSPMRLTMHGEEQLGDGLLCLAVYPTPELVSLKADLDRALLKEGFFLEARSFRPHITLARRFFGNSMLDTGIRASVSKITLFASAVNEKKRIYTELYTKKADM